MAEKRGNNSDGNSNQGAFALLIILLFFLALIDIASLIILKPSLSPTPPQSSTEETVKVAQVIDGESFTIDNGDTVKLIGIDAPSPEGKYYEESKRFLEFLISNKTLTLEKDVEDKDSSRNLLRYAYVNYNGKQVFVNLESARQGYSLPFHIGKNVKYRTEIEQARNQCITEQLNLCGSI